MLADSFLFIVVAPASTRLSVLLLNAVPLFWVMAYGLAVNWLFLVGRGIIGRGVTQGVGGNSVNGTDFPIKGLGNLFRLRANKSIKTTNILNSNTNLEPEQRLHAIETCHSTSSFSRLPSSQPMCKVL
jgi:hypothetical protein